MANVMVNVCGEEREYPAGTQLLEVAEEYKKIFRYDIALAMVDNKLSELTKALKPNSKVKFITTGFSYCNELHFTVWLKCFCKLTKFVVDHS